MIENSTISEGNPMKHSLFSIAFIVGLSACSSANAGPVYHSPQLASGGYWQLNPNKCPDLVEDRRDRRESRRDERYDYSRSDVREDRRDRAESRRDLTITNCPRSAWDWHGARYNARHHAPRPVDVKIYYDPDERNYYYRSGKRRVHVRW